MDVENSDMSDDEMLQFSGNTRWHEFDCEIEILQQKTNKIYKVIEKLPNNGCDVSNILENGRTHRRAKEVLVSVMDEVCEIIIPDEIEILQHKANKTHKVLEKVPNNGCNLSNGLQH